MEKESLSKLLPPPLFFGIKLTIMFENIIFLIKNLKYLDDFLVRVLVNKNYSLNVLNHSSLTDFC